MTSFHDVFERVHPAATQPKITSTPKPTPRKSRSKAALDAPRTPSATPEPWQTHFDNLTRTLKPSGPHPADSIINQLKLSDPSWAAKMKVEAADATYFAAFVAGKLPSPPESSRSSDFAVRGARNSKFHDYRNDINYF